MSDLTQDLIHIAIGHLLPGNPKKYAWVSAVEVGPYHIETNDSAANGGQGFKALCGAAGYFNYHIPAAQIFPSQKCKACVEISQSSTNILDVAQQQAQPTSEVNHESGTGVVANRKPLTNTNCDTQILCENSITWRGEAVSPAAPLNDRFGDDRFTDNILRALDGLPQHGDDEEERDAAEEGALIEASGYQDPKFESNGRY